ncbi:MAG: HAMP domain-containing histidine kinase [Deltaproteobacteria bacterium]|nr:HAMP domain-containing histidine kinase [Deltaproteobacteria bacterium]
MRNLVFIISAADELMMAENNIPEQWLVNLQNIDQATNRISDFLNDLLVVAKEEKGRLTVCRCEVDLKSLAEDVVAKSDVLAQGRKVVLLAHVPETVGMVNLDVNLIRRMLDNLLSNAIKFSPVGGTVTLEVDVTHAANDLKLNSRRVRFKVFDEGPGIDEQDYDRIFEYFKTVPGFQANSPQIGLGLTLCKLVAEAHEGSILISANNPTGSIFEVDING